MNKLFQRFGQPFEWMSKMDNAKWTGKPFEWMKVLLIHTIGLPIVQMNKLLKWFWKPFRAHGLIMERVMLLCIVFISFAIVVNFKAFILKIENGDYFNFLSK